MADTHDKNGHKVDGKGNVTHDPQCSVCAPMSNEIEKKGMTNEKIEQELRELLRACDNKDTAENTAIHYAQVVYALGREEALKEAERAKGQRRAVPIEVIREWAERHYIQGTDTDLRCAFEDARSLRTKGKV